MSNLLSNYDRILDSTRDLIISGGYNGFSYADISEIVGIRKASIHHHFPTKADLVLKLVSQYRKDAEVGTAALEQNVANPVDRVRAFIDHWAQCINEGSRPFCVCALLASEILLLPPDVAVEVRAYFKLLSGWFARTFEHGVRLGFIHIARAPDVEAELFMATVHGAMLSARAYGDASKFSIITSAALDPLIRKH